MDMRLFSLLFLTVLLFGSVQALAKVYRWVDQDGNVVYSQVAPAQGEAEEVKVRPTPPASVPPAQPPAESDKDGVGAPGTPLDPEEAEAFDREQALIRKQNCEAARQNLSLFQRIGNRLVKGSDGTYKRYGDKEREEAIEHSKQQIKEYCTE
ncbi:MAG: hypothetical protein B0D96_00685 [Candidatus Sedimenticola endophacoides]|uniref:DUF4124 domain-containing protein n=1 Tax=Candidatus Sedimenticola endophacoides TaxID=2548426 RepID=A0A657Q0B1_9GAMM|nr:MAG: hypothetical protein B0D94_01505 [Candidatus Sedimenticola endophacoides]OQX37657.1 MAG: hypothetical protein B0D84_00400 [Candidatus Sedimenticola endophacoides]OQX38187.1 MAG: hypothetical protein B0D96_00685 [Candidatus Sedimenticola endophacoides]OQX40605.1 MAG: hypothetical protein B0D88_08475 [Candidatus Sedimenticola endophacoides]OQX41648.1 MAG: hypothetical protein B0D82_02150 [Candidatus Sedimenticola endophacoides]